jgi:hypothetical protein
VGGWSTLTFLCRALVGVTDPKGQSIFAGRRFTGFSNVEEQQMQAVDAIPFLLEDRIKELGGKYEKAAEPWGVRKQFFIEHFRLTC